MSSPHSETQRKKRLIITLVVSALIILALAAVGIYGLITGPQQPDQSAPPSAPPPVAPWRGSPGDPAARIITANEQPGRLCACRRRRPV